MSLISWGFKITKGGVSMGKSAVKITGLNVEELISELNKAYADERLAYFSYWYMAKMVTGAGYKGMEEMLSKIAKDEEEHAQELAERIIELGGKPISNPSDFEKNANFSYPEPPQKMSDYDAIIKTVLEAEAGAIDVYQKLADKTFGKDHVTYQLITHILQEEIAHEELFENLKE